METNAKIPEVGKNNSNDVVRGESESYSGRGKRKRQWSSGVDGILFKKSKMIADEGNNTSLIFIKIFKCSKIWVLKLFLF